MSLKFFFVISTTILLTNQAKLPEPYFRINFQHCLLDYLHEINLITYISPHDESHYQDCHQFHAELNSTMKKMYKVLKFNLERTLDTPDETECLMSVFKHSKFLEYNVIATTAMQLEEDSHQKLESVLSISKGIFVYGVVKCLISQQLLIEIFNDFSEKMTLNEREIECIENEVYGRNLLDKIFIDDLNEYFNGKFSADGSEKFDTDLNVATISDIFNASSSGGVQIDESTMKLGDDGIPARINEIFIEVTEIIPVKLRNVVETNGEKSKNGEIKNEVRSEFEGSASDVNKSEGFATDENINEGSAATEIIEISDKKQNNDENKIEGSATVQKNEFSDKNEVENYSKGSKTTQNIELLYKKSINDENLENNDEKIDGNDNEGSETTEKIEILTPTSDNPKIENESIENSSENYKIGVRIEFEGFETTDIPEVIATFSNESETDENIDEITELPILNESNEIQSTTIGFLDESNLKNPEFSENFQDFNKTSSKIEENFEKISKGIKSLKINLNSAPLPDENLPISDSNIKKRDLSQKTCTELLPQIKSRILHYSFSEFSPDENNCMSSKVTEDDVDAVYAFIVMKRISKSEQQKDFRNRKLMDLLFSIVEKYVDCTDLYGLMQMVKIPVGSSEE